MRWRIRKCPSCGRYTLKERCPRCGSLTIVAHPHRFSPEDKYVRYRVMIKYPHIVAKYLNRETVAKKAQDTE